MSCAAAEESSPSPRAVAPHQAEKDRLSRAVVGMSSSTAAIGDPGHLSTAFNCPPPPSPPSSNLFPSHHAYGSSSRTRPRPCVHGVLLLPSCLSCHRRRSNVLLDAVAVGALSTPSCCNRMNRLPIPVVGVKEGQEEKTSLI